MTFPRTVFLDSDVVISSLLSRRGAAHLLIRQTDVQKWISNLSRKEIIIVAERLGIADEAAKQILALPRVVKLTDNADEIRKKFENYVDDPNDAHVVAGAVAAGVGYVVTYNLKHFRVENIRSDFELVVMTPGTFLQYLRSL